MYNYTETHKKLTKKRYLIQQSIKKTKESQTSEL